MFRIFPSTVLNLRTVESFSSIKKANPSVMTDLRKMSSNVSFMKHLANMPNVSLMRHLVGQSGHLKRWVKLRSCMREGKGVRKKVDSLSTLKKAQPVPCASDLVAAKEKQGV